MHICIRTSGCARVPSSPSCQTARGCGQKRVAQAAAAAASAAAATAATAAAAAAAAAALAKMTVNN